MRLPNLKVLGVVGFIVMGAVAAVLGCPFFRNPANFASAGGSIGYVRYLLDAHRKK